MDNYALKENTYNVSEPAAKFQGIAVDQDGNLIAVGNNYLAKNKTNAFIAKFNGTTGELISHRMAGTASPTVAGSGLKDNNTSDYLGVETLKDGSYLVVGTATNDAETEEGWRCYGTQDIVIVRYSSDLSRVLYVRNVGTLDGLAGNTSTNGATEFEGITATEDGGYLLYGTSNTTIIERDLLEQGYTWGNYGSNDGIIVKYDADNKVQWCQNYGTTAGDWIYDVIVDEEDGVITAVGQTRGENGTPSWTWHGAAKGCSNPFDAFVMCSRMYSAAYTPGHAVSASLSDTLRADGTYTGSAAGHRSEVTVQVEIKSGKISSVEAVSQDETPEKWQSAKALFTSIVNGQTPEVDTVSGATNSSNAIKKAVTSCLAQAAASTARSNIIHFIDSNGNIKDSYSKYSDTIGNHNKVINAISAYEGLSAYEKQYITEEELTILKTVATTYGYSVSEESTASESDEAPDLLDTTYNDTYWSTQSKDFNNVHATALAGNGLTGKGVKIAVIDSGLVSNSADLDYSHILEGYDYVTGKPMGGQSADNEELTDTSGHGTRIIGILQAISNNETGIAGLLSEADIIPLRISGGKTQAASEQVAQTIRDAVDKYGTDVIATSVDLIDTTALKEAIAYAAEKNVLVVAANGNSGSADSTMDAYVYPAAYDSVIAVGAVDQTGTVKVNSTKNDKVDVVAPGNKIVSLGLSAMGYRCTLKSGTSFSSPYVSAMAAALKQNYPDATVAQFRNLLINTSQDKGDAGYDNSYGYGLIDMASYAVAAKNKFKVTLDKESAILTNGYSQTLTASVEKSGIWEIQPDTKDVTWSSSDETVVKVDETGKVQALKQGKAVVTATAKADGVSQATCEITVTARRNNIHITPPADNTNNSAGTSGSSETTTGQTNTSIKDTAAEDSVDIPVTIVKQGVSETVKQGSARADGVYKDASGNVLANSIVQSDDGKKVIVDMQGKAVSAEVVQTDSGKKLVANENGELASSEVVKTQDGKTVVADADGELAVSKIVAVADGTKVLANTDGELAVNEVVEINGKKYAANEDGVLASKEFVSTDSNKKVYANKNGQVITNKVFRVSNKKYVSAKDGTIYTNTFVKKDGNLYFTKKSGAVVTGKKKTFSVKGKQYIAKKSGAVYTNTTVKIGNKKYTVNKKGRVTKVTKIKKK